MTDQPAAPADDESPCSAKGCRAAAVWALRWNNPKIHDPERRKIWLACDDHREYLSNFLDRRGFLRDVVSVADLGLSGSGPAVQPHQDRRDAGEASVYSRVAARSIV